MKTAKVLKTIIIILVLLLAGALAGGAYYLKQQSERTSFFAKTKVNGTDMSGKTPQEALTVLSSDYGNVTVTIKETQDSFITGQLADFGYVVDQEKLLVNLERAQEQQKESITTLIGSLVKGNDFRVTIPFTFYEEKFLAKVNAAQLPAERVKSVKAKMKFNRKEEYYYIRPEVYGTEFSDADLQSYVKEKLDGFVGENHPNDSIQIDFPTQIYYQPSRTSQDINLNTKVNVYNQFCKAKVTYVFGSVKETIDWNTIKEWLSIQNGEGVLDDTLVSEYINNMAARYNTRHYDRNFHTSLGTDIVIPSSENDYGYGVNEQAEFKQLIADIRSNTTVEREPVYYSVSTDYENPLYYKRDGRDDLAGTYVEVNLTTQHMWFYKDGALIVDSDIVSGCVAKEAETKTGTFPLAYKESPSVLRGEDAEDGYETEVQYWMPFFEGQGLHDADWRRNFGGNIYLTNGSHGCVNLPPYAAQAIYNNIEPGVAIIIYK